MLKLMSKMLWLPTIREGFGGMPKGGIQNFGISTIIPNKCFHNKSVVLKSGNTLHLNHM